MSAASSSILLATFSSGSLASTLSVVGLPGTIPLGGCFALTSPGLIIPSKKLDSATKKHQEIFTLAIARRDTVDGLISKAMVDNLSSDTEFQFS